MKYSLATIALLPRGETRHAEVTERQSILDRAARAGFTGLEISPNWIDFDQANFGGLRRFRGEASNVGLSISGINLNRCLSTSGPHAKECLLRIQRTVDVAACLEATVITLSLSLPFEPNRTRILRGCEVTDEERDRVATIICRLADDASREGIALSLELHDDGLLDTPELCLEFLGLIGRDNVGINPDVGNLCRGPQPLPDWRRAFRMLAPYSNNWHVKNYHGFQPAPIWCGDIDYSEVFPIMRDAGYDGWVSFESYFGEVWSVQEQSLAYLNRLSATTKSGGQPA